jgi:hypothetical protein
MGNITNVLGAFRRTRLLVMSSLAAGVLLAGVYTMPASAISPCDASPGAVACFWQHANYSGNAFTMQSVTLGYCYAMPAYLNNAVSSVENDVGRRLVLFDNSNCTGATKEIAAYSENPNLSSWIGGFNDKASSFRWDTF